MSSRIPEGTYVYAAPMSPPWEQTSPPTVTLPGTGVTMTLLEQPLLQRLEALEREVKELKRALSDVKEHAEIKTEIAAIRGAMTELLTKMGKRPSRGKRT